MAIDVSRVAKFNTLAQERANARAFAAWLRSTLIPDLHESGMVCTAESFEEAATHIETLLDR